MKKNKGCVHLIVKDGKIINVFTHLKKIPKNGIIHLKADKIYSFNELKNHILMIYMNLKNIKK